MCPETEDVFTEDFWSKLTVVITALDNVEARKYVDEKCVFHSRPLLDSGTMGAKGSVQVVLPRMTQSYSDSDDPPPTSIPMCTERYFITKAEHALFWATLRFEFMFGTMAEKDSRKKEEEWQKAYYDFQLMGADHGPDIKCVSAYSLYLNLRISSLDRRPAALPGRATPSSSTL